ncbi:response regulator [Novosphingobium olei]|uniref:Response regulator n=1 Tax=Novosphingobium olei TaxID=2728851 RepID=A0A7Y0BNA6_9SPHN|nr:response regulator [Novosphingobium olei]NML93525.1 response regulator [Novosphingobium olei]
MKTVMIVDDSPTILMSMEAILTRAGYGVLKADSGENALRALQGGGKPNLVITDLNMAAMSGIDLIRNLRQLPQTRFTPIIMLTTESSLDKRQEARSAGATGWIVKPVQPTDLLAVVKHMVPGS